MNVYIHYHNVEQEGLLLSDPPFSERRLGVHTRKSHVQDAKGRVFLLAGFGKPRQNFLCQTFLIEKVNKKRDGTFEAWGKGWELAPPQQIKGKAFERFRSACANFVAFRCVNDLSYARTLLKLAEAHRPPAKPHETIKFLKKLLNLLPGPHADRGDVPDLFARLEPMRALSVRQPQAEAIMRGTRKVEHRSGPTHVRGRVLIYAARGRHPAAAEAIMMKAYGIRDVTCDDLDRGVLVGTLDLYDGDGGKWYFRDPRRAEKLVRPRNPPQPGWFYPS
jgi:hypothetical protein